MPPFFIFSVTIIRRIFYACAGQTIFKFDVLLPIYAWRHSYSSTGSYQYVVPFGLQFIDNYRNSRRFQHKERFHQQICLILVKSCYTMNNVKKKVPIPWKFWISARNALDIQNSSIFPPRPYDPPPIWGRNFLQFETSWFQKVQHLPQLTDGVLKTSPDLCQLFMPILFVQ